MFAAVLALPCAACVAIASGTVSPCSKQFLLKRLTKTQWSSIWMVTLIPGYSVPHTGSNACKQTPNLVHIVTHVVQRFYLLFTLVLGIYVLADHKYLDRHWCRLCAIANFCLRVWGSGCTQSAKELLISLTKMWVVCVPSSWEFV